MHKLTIEDDEGKTVVVPLIRDEITVGRQEGNSIRLTERNISRRHARFFRQNGTLFVEDLGSFNGIRVNGGRLSSPTPLKDGDLVIIGDYKLTVRADRPVATRLYGAGAPFSGPTGTAAVPAPPALAPTAALPAGGLGMQTRASSLPATAPPPDAALDAAPTIPVRTLAEQSLAPGQAPGMAPARLVVVTTNLAGTEFVLDRPSLVIGRTPENDIVLNHKSISRHHAKVIRDGDKYIVVDLESANGVRVNGSEFERVELKSGDTLELGHVRLRFTSGADYVDFDIGEAGRNRRRLMFAGIGGAVVVTGFALAFAMRAGEESGPEPIKAPQAAAPVGAGSPDPTPAPMPPVPTGPSGPGGSPDGLLAKAKAAKARENWDVALESVKAALDLSPLSQEAVTLREAIESEQEASVRFTKIKEAARANNHEEVLNLFGGIAESSVYRPRALSMRRTAQKKVIELRLAEAQKLAGRGDCTGTKAEVDRVLALDPEHDAARATLERCERTLAKAAEKQKREEREALAKQEAEKKAAERAAAKAESDRIAKEERAAKAAIAKEEADKKAAAKAESDRIAKEEADKKAAAKAESDRIAKEERAAKAAIAKEEADKKAAAKAESDRIAKEERAAKEAAAKEQREAAAREAKEARDREKREREALAETQRKEKEAARLAAASTRETASEPAGAKAVVPSSARPPSPPAPRTVASASTPKPAAASGSGSGSKAAAAAEPSGGDPEVLLADAQAAWLRGQYTVAIDSSRRALRIRPGLTQAYQIIAACSCSLRDAAGATKAYERLDDKMKPMVKTWCQKSGITLN
jgi:pSer/pThr/pTyr-binding forkhead associated (FHA) protein